MIGTVTYYNKDKGYGYIRDNATGNSYSCYYKNIKDSVIDVGYTVDFKAFYSHKADRVCATDVQVIESRPVKRQKKER